MKKLILLLILILVMSLFANIISAQNVVYGEVVNYGEIAIPSKLSDISIKIPSSFSLVKDQTAKVANYQDMRIKLAGIFTNSQCSSDDVKKPCPGSYFKEYVKIEVSVPGGCGFNATPGCLGPPGMAKEVTLYEGENVEVFNTKLTLREVVKDKAILYMEFKEGKEKNIDYVPGELIVVFHDYVTEERANKLFEDYNSKLIKFESHFSKELRWGIVKVPEKEEQKWIKIFEKEDIVKYVELKGIYRAEPPPIVTSEGQFGVISPKAKVISEEQNGTFLIKEGSITSISEQAGLVSSIGKGSTVQEGSASVKILNNLFVEENKLLMETSEGNKEVKVMPSTASDIAINQLNLKSYEIELKDAGRPVYNVIGKRDIKILGLIKSEMKIQTRVSAETGDIETTEKPWWSFLVKEE
ncbi:hypothetical protein HY500_04590 [Candidatus Woesearchaeota archaeon]|nr:hypothetical protein [Candidatus Woesearchaeota archaeon]